MEREEKRGKEKAELWKETKVMVNQYNLLLLVSDPIEATIFGYLVYGDKTFS